MINIMIRPVAGVAQLVVLVACWCVISTSSGDQCFLKNGQCTYNINLSPSGSCSPSAEGKKVQESAPEAIRQHDDSKMYQMQQDLNIVKSDHENRIKELESSIQKVLRNSIQTVPIDYGTTSNSNVRIEARGRDSFNQRAPRPPVRSTGGPSENILMLQLQNQFNKIRTSLSTRTADLLETKNKLNETLDLLTEAQRQVFVSSNKLVEFETKAAVLERETNILKNKLKDKTERLEYSTERLNTTESQLIGIETRLYDVVRSEATLKEELETCKHKLNQTQILMAETQRNHTEMSKKYQRVKKTLTLREAELMECYTAKTQTFCGFEDPDMCGFTQTNESDSFDWERAQGRTPSANTGPEADHTCKDRKGHFMYIEASGKSRGSSAKMYSPKYRGMSAQCIQFFYHMTGRHIGTLTIHSKLLTSTELKSIWRVFGNQGNLWIKASVSIPEDTATAGYQIIFEGSTSSGYEGDISIDDFSIKDGLCESDRISGARPAPITDETRSKTLNTQIDRYRKLLRRRMRQRNQNQNSGDVSSG